MDKEQEMQNVGNDQFISKLKDQWPQVIEAVQALVQQMQPQQDLSQGEVAPGVSGQPQPQPEQSPQTSPQQQVQI
jgi:hypothetical protein